MAVVQQIFIICEQDKVYDFQTSEKVVHHGLKINNCIIDGNCNFLELLIMELLY